MLRLNSTVRTYGYALSVTRDSTIAAPPQEFSLSHPEAAEEATLFRCGRSWSSANIWRDRAGFIEFPVSSPQFALLRALQPREREPRNPRVYGQGRSGASIPQRRMRRVGRRYDSPAQSLVSKAMDRLLRRRIVPPAHPSHRKAKSERWVHVIGDSAAKAARHDWTLPLSPAHRSETRTLLRLFLR